VFNELISHKDLYNDPEFFNRKLDVLSRFGLFFHGCQSRKAAWRPSSQGTKMIFSHKERLQHKI
jgi:hypothetical protein